MAIKMCMELVPAEYGGGFTTCGIRKAEGSNKYCFFHRLSRMKLVDRARAWDGWIGMPRELFHGVAWFTCTTCLKNVPEWFEGGRHPGRRCGICFRTRAAQKRREKVYGITPKQHEAILNRQDGRCAICCCSPRTRALAVDHDHRTGLVRGLLCSKCNHDLLGAAHDSVLILQRAAEYLKYPPAQDLGSSSDGAVLRVPK